MNATHDVRGANDRRIARMGVWIDLAESSAPADHVRFAFYWIAYEAGYQVRTADSRSVRTQRGDFPGFVESPRGQFHRRAARRDAAGLQKMLIMHRKRIATILELRQAHPSFWERWEEDAGVGTKEDWEERFRARVRADVRRLTVAMRGGASQDVARTVDDLFRNLAVVRNQIVHGGSAGSRSRGRTQVRLGAELLKDFIPHFRRTIEHHRDHDWGLPPFPRVGDDADDKCLPPWLRVDAARCGVDTERE